MFENLTMYQALKNAKEKTPNGRAIYFLGKKISYTSFLNKIDQTASFLYHDLNIRKGDTVLLALPNIPDSLIILYAINKIGAIANMVHPFTPYNQLISIYESTNSKVAFLFERRVYNELEKYVSFPYPYYVCRIEDYLPLAIKGEYRYIQNRKYRIALEKKNGKKIKFLRDYKIKTRDTKTENDENKPAIILHSGSTTGDPKTICLSNSNFNSTAELACEILGLTKEEVKGKAMLSALPNFHGFGLCMTMHSPLVNCFGTVLVPKFSAKYVTSSINGSKNVISICGVPRVYEALVSSRVFWSSKHIKKLHVCFAGGDVLKKETKSIFDHEMEKRHYHCRLFEGYGLSEATSVICVNTFAHNKEDSIGYPLRGNEIKILNLKNEECQVKEKGEIVVKSPSNMLGYGKSLDRSAFKDNYLHTGDIGYKDEEGFIYFSSRLKRVVKVSGVATFPNEVEKFLSSIPGVKDVCVIGVEDSIMGHALKAFIVTDYVDKQAFRELLLDNCQKYLLKWSVPKYFEFLDSLPKTLFEKTDYLKLK